VGVVGAVERGLAQGANGVDAAEEDVGGREEREASVMKLVVVPAEDALEPRPSVELGGGRDSPAFST
jgi:hypothetical protein